MNVSEICSQFLNGIVYFVCMHYPLVSVIIPTYNRVELLSRAVQSVLKQTLQDFEVIVVNDCGQSVEETLLQLDQDQHRIVSLRSRINLGRGGVRNLGLQIACGEYIAYLDDDDYYYPEHLETLVNFARQGNHDVVYADSLNAIQVKNHGQWVTQQTKLVYSQDFDYSKIFVENFVPTLCFLHKKECLQQTGLFDESLSSHEDWDLWIRMSLHYKMEHLKQVTSEYTTRLGEATGQITTDLNSDFYETQQRIYAKYLSYAVQREGVLQQQQITGETLKRSYEVQRATKVREFMTQVMFFVDQQKFVEALDFYDQSKEFHKVVGFENECARISDLMNKLRTVVSRK